MKTTLLLLLSALSSTLSIQAFASQGLLSCEGPKASVELWFSGEPQPSYTYVYQLDPAFGLPGEHIVSAWNKTTNGLHFTLRSEVTEYTLLEFDLQYVPATGSYSGTLTATDANGVNITSPNNTCTFY